MNPVNHTMLLVEDNEDDIFLMRRALQLCRICNPLKILTDGQQALDYLSGAGVYADREQHPLPFIIFLDLKLPYIDGFDILAWMRQQSAPTAVPVIVLTGSAETRDQGRAYSLGARSYLIKPPRPEIIIEIFESLKSYWLSKDDEMPVLTHEGKRDYLPVSYESRRRHTCSGA